MAIDFANPPPPYNANASGVVVRIDTLRGFDLVQGASVHEEVLFRVMIGGVFSDLITPVMY